MANQGKPLLVIQNGTLIDGAGNPPTPNQAMVIEGNRITHIGSLPEHLLHDDRDNLEIIDATGRWIMPGLIDGHCHLSFGFPRSPEDRARAVLPVRDLAPYGRRAMPSRCCAAASPALLCLVAPGSTMWPSAMPSPQSSLKGHASPVPGALSSPMAASRTTNHHGWAHRSIPSGSWPMMSGR